MQRASSVPAWAVFAFGTALTLIGSWIPSFWNDEVATLRLARLPIGELLAFVHEKDAVHAVYALLMHGWIAVFGESELAVRAPSAFATGAAATGVLVLLRQLDQPRAAVVAAFVFILLPRSSFNGSEARSYALTTALVMAGAVLVVRAAREGGVLRWIAFTIVAGLANAVFLYSVLVLPAFAVLAATAAPAARRRRAFGGTVLGGIGSVLLASPVLIAAAGQSSQIGWLAAQPVNVYTVVVESFFGSAWWLAALIIAVLLFAAIGSPLRRARLLPALAVWLLGPAAILLLGTALVEPVFTPRYLSMSSPALSIAVGLALVSWRPVVSWTLAGALVLAALPAFVSMRVETGKPAGQDLRGLARAIDDRSRPGDAFLLADSGTVSLRPRLALAAYPAAFAGLDDVALARPYTRTGTYSDGLLGGQELRAALRAEDRVWTAVPESDAESLDWLAAEGFVRRDETRVPTVILTLWERDA